MSHKLVAAALLSLGIGACTPSQHTQETPETPTVERLDNGATEVQSAVSEEVRDELSETMAEVSPEQAQLHRTMDELLRFFRRRSAAIHTMELNSKDITINGNTGQLHITRNELDFILTVTYTDGHYNYAFDYVRPEYQEGDPLVSGSVVPKRSTYEEIGEVAMGAMRKAWWTPPEGYKKEQFQSIVTAIHDACQSTESVSEVALIKRGTEVHIRFRANEETHTLVLSQGGHSVHFSFDGSEDDHITDSYDSGTASHQICGYMQINAPGLCRNVE